MYIKRKKTEKYLTVGTVPKYNRIIVERAVNSIPLAHTYMTLSTHIHVPWHTDT
jgi:hypothetical protein